MDAAQAQMDSLDAQVSEQEVQLHYYKVVAPRGGIVGDIPVRVGDRVTTSTQLTTVDQPGSLEAYVYVPIEHSSQLKMNLPVQVLDSDGKVLADTRVSFISPQVDNTTQTVLVKARIANGNDALRQSQFIRARVVWGTHQNPEVPILAVSRLAGQYFAFVAEPQNGGSFVAQQKPLTDRTDGGQRLRSAGWHQAGRQSDCFRDAVSAGWGAGDSAELGGFAVRRFAMSRPCSFRRPSTGSHFQHSCCKLALKPRTGFFMFVNFFIRRPVFATVCALLIVLAGAAVIPTLPIAQFPNLAPPQVGVTSVYIGASAQTVESAVTIPLEQQINGAEGMKYITSTSGNDGTSSIVVTFDLTRDPDLATVDIQNRVNTAQGRLPGAVKAVGITTQKTSQNFVFGAAVISDNNKYSTLFMSNYLDVYVQGLAEAHSGRRRRDHLRRAQILDAAVAGPGADGGTRADRTRRGECACRSRTWKSRPDRWGSSRRCRDSSTRSACGPWDG